MSRIYAAVSNKGGAGKTTLVTKCECPLDRFSISAMSCSVAALSSASICRRSSRVGALRASVRSSDVLFGRHLRLLDVCER
jgi:hypothetical protein